MSLLIKNAFLDGKTVDIFIKNGKFEKIAPHLDMSQTDEILDAKGMGIFPAFYNTHCHSGMSALKGLGDGKGPFDWLNEEIFPREAKLTPEDIYNASKLSILEMIKTGTVFFADMYFSPEETIKAVEEMGVRAFISFVQFDLFDKDEANRRKKQALEFILKENPCPDRILKGISCHAVYTVSEDLFKWTADFAKEKGFYVHIHANETQKEVEDCLEKYGKRPIEMFYKWGLLTPKTLLAHCVHLNDIEMDIMAETGAFSATCPCSNMKLGSGFYPYLKMKEKNILQTIGTDGVSSNNNLNMLEEMKFTSLMAKGRAYDASIATASEVFKMATENGAKAFGFKAGKIKEGYLADFMLVDLNHYSMKPGYDLVSNLVYSASSEAIQTVACQGKILMKDRVVEGEDEIVAKAEYLFNKLKDI